MTEFPTLVYRDGGPYQRRGGTFSSIPVNDQDELEAALADGCVTHPDLIGKAVDQDNAPPTRAELEAKATELGLKFDGRTSDRKLLAAIDAALAAKG